MKIQKLKNIFLLSACFLFQALYADNSETQQVYIDCGHKQITRIDSEVCQAQKNEQFIGLKNIYLKQIEHYLEYKNPEAWALFQQEELAWQKYMETMSEFIYRSYGRGSGRNLASINMEMSLLRERIQALTYFIQKEKLGLVAVLKNYDQKHLTSDDKIEVSDWRCAKDFIDIWEKCIQKQEEQLRSLLSFHRSIVYKFHHDDVILFYFYFKSQLDWQIYYQKALLFGQSYWNNEYEGKHWGNYAIKTAIIGFYDLIGSDDFSRIPVIYLD